ncbi:MAG: preprotein translocase subunit SecE [Acidobacteriota bacterium]|nr:preprotein translocase subunit SecE [Acidobacteriota bacterium]
MSIAESWKRMTRFFSETRSEMTKVTFPSRAEVVSTTIVVIVASIVFAFFLWVSDMVIIKVYQTVLGFFGK